MNTAPRSANSAPTTPQPVTSATEAQSLVRSLLATTATLVTAVEQETALVRAGHVQQAVPLHPGHRLADCRAGLGQSLRDPRAQRNDPLLLQFKDRAEIHLRRVDKPMGSH